LKDKLESSGFEVAEREDPRETDDQIGFLRASKNGSS
jgi:hypothetical protein